ncbi:hypothetical protein LCGC14_0817100 [marine sediment metagenome]|uniref:Uncharacterized protein n=1 Tax=marine sediment metagenome TaxID=412755 RepID=A0A0F9PPJ9_9ZZZZ
MMLLAWMNRVVERLIDWEGDSFLRHMLISTLLWGSIAGALAGMELLIYMAIAWVMG